MSEYKKLTPEEVEAMKAKMAPPLPAMDDDKLTELARNIVTNVVWIAPLWYEGFEYSFGWLLKMCDPSTIPSNLVAMYAKVSEAAPRVINGYPMFFGGSMVGEEDWDRLVTKIEEMEKALGIKREEVS